MPSVEQQVWDQFVKGPTVTHDENCKCPFCVRRAANLKRLDELNIREYPDTFVRILEIQTEQAGLIGELRQAVNHLNFEIAELKKPKDAPRLNWFGKVLVWLSSI